MKSQQPATPHPSSRSNPLAQPSSNPDAPPSSLSEGLSLDDPTVLTERSYLDEQTVLLDRYRIARRLGEGGMGVVYLTEQLGTARWVAVKTLRPLVSGGEARQRFLREGRLLARLQHPNIVTVYETGALPDGTLFLSMEYIPGRSLDQELATGPLPLERVLRIGEQLARALVAAHQLRIVHRDLKPSNVLITQAAGEEADLVKMLDFGIARILQDGDSPEEAAKLTASGLVLGTPQYMSPEQVCGRPVGPPSDIYCLGLILYRMAAGRPAIDAPTPVAFLRAHAEDLPLPLESVLSPGQAPVALSQLIDRCLAKDPGQRPTADEVRATLAELRLRQAAARLDAGTRPAPRETGAGRGWLLYLTLGVSLLALLAVGTTLLFVLRQPARSGPAGAGSTSVPTAEADVDDGAGGQAVGSAVPPPLGRAIPAGEVLVPGAKGQPAQQSVAAFRLDPTEVSQAEYETCVAEGVCRPSQLPRDTGSDGRLPAVGISPELAETFCRWRGGRLPSQAEWIRGARGDRTWPYAVGPELPPGCCNLSGDGDGHPGAAPVGTLTGDTSLYAVQDLTGNVSEWVTTDPAGQDRTWLALGGSWLLAPPEAAIQYASQRFPKDAWFHFIGFRCAYDE